MSLSAQYVTLVSRPGVAHEGAGQPAARAATQTGAARSTSSSAPRSVCSAHGRHPPHPVRFRTAGSPHGLLEREQVFGPAAGGRSQRARNEASVPTDIV